MTALIEKYGRYQTNARVQRNGAQLDKKQHRSVSQPVRVITIDLLLQAFRRATQKTSAENLYTSANLSL